MAIDDTLPALDKYATLMIPGKDPIKLPILKGTLGPEVIDIRELGKQGYFTYDPGFVSTASCMSRITFIDGKKGVIQGKVISGRVNYSSRLIIKASLTCCIISPSK